MKKLLLPAVLILLVTIGCLYAPTTKIPPTAYIDTVYPTNAICGETVDFKGHGIDPDGTVGAYDWRSSRDGDLSTAPSFSTSTLSSGTHTIWFRVQDNDGQWSNEVSATVVVASVAETKPVVNSFTANPDNIDPGESSTLSWDVTGCTNVTINQSIGSVGLNGARVVSPSKTTTYTLTAVNQQGNTVANVQVVVGQKPITKVELYSVADEDGQVSRNGSIGPQPLIGDALSGVVIQGFFSFDISSIPKEATITSATLDLVTSDTFGDPFTALGRLYIYECHYSKLQPKDFTVGPPIPGALYSSVSLFNNSVSSDVLLNAIQERVNEDSNRFQIRIQSEKTQAYRSPSYTPQTNNNLADYIAFSIERTKLTVRYQY